MPQTWEAVWVGGSCITPVSRGLTGDILNPGSIPTRRFTEDTGWEVGPDPKAHTLHSMWALVEKGGGFSVHKTGGRMAQ